MPQGSYLGPLTFVILIDSLRPGCLTHKFVDDTTMTEISNKSVVSSMQSFVDELVQQAAEAGNDCQRSVNKRNTIRPNSQRPAAVRHLEGYTPVERVTTFKLLRVHVANDLKWMQHVHAVSSKVSSRLYFLKQLKRSGTGAGGLTVFLRHSDTSSASIRMPSVALETHCCTDKGA